MPNSGLDLSPAQQRMIVASEPSDRDRREGCGVELRTGADYAIAKALERRGFGHVVGPGSPLGGMYWNNGDGLALRRELRGESDPDDDESDD